MIVTKFVIIIIIQWSPAKITVLGMKVNRDVRRTVMLEGFKGDTPCSDKLNDFKSLDRKPLLACLPAIRKLSPFAKKLCPLIETTPILTAYWLNTVAGCQF